MPKVKICGNTNIEDAKLALELGADYLGFIFTESKRKIDMRTATKIMEALPYFNNFVAVFLNQEKKNVEAIVSELGIKTIQFHGEETARYCSYFMEKNYQVIKTFRIKDEMSLKRMDEYNATAFLFDTFSKDEGGGTGKAFDWNLIKEKAYVHDKLFLAGGLTIDNLQQAIDEVHPYAVDVASGVEASPGIKDPGLLKSFIQIAKGGSSKSAKQGPVHT